MDIALCVALIGDRQLHLHGRRSKWGRTLRIGAAIAALILNCGVAVALGWYYLAFLHTITPLLLIGLMEYDQDTQLQFAEIHKQAEDDETAHHDEAVAARQQGLESRRQERDVLAGEVVVLQQQLATERDKRATAEQALRDKDRDTTPETPRDKQRAKRVATPDERRAWVRQQRNNGHDVTGSGVHKQFPDAPRDGARIVRQVQAELDAELVAVTTGGK